MPSGLRATQRPPTVSPGQGPFTCAVGVGFEPTVACATTVFKIVCSRRDLVLCQGTRHHGPMRRRRPRYCHGHQVGAVNPHTPLDRALQRNKQGVCGVEGCHFTIDRRGRVREIRGSNVEDVLRAHRESARQTGPQHRGPWLSGSFYLIAFIAITATTITAGSLAPPRTVPIVVASSLLGVGTVGALQLRHDDRLSERRLVELIKLTFLNLPALLRRSTSLAEPPLDSSTSQADTSRQSAPPS